VLEGVAFELRRLQQTRGSPLPTDVLTLKGGGARNELWCQIISGVFGIPYRTTHRDAAYGAALTAGVSSGWWPDWQSVPGLSGQINESGLIDAEVLGERYARYRTVVDALTPVA
jgi:sugar (pentulose or hexulose) kinase